MSKKNREAFSIAGNWKMNCTQAETESFFSALKSQNLATAAPHFSKSFTRSFDFSSDAIARDSADCFRACGLPDRYRRAECALGEKRRFHRRSLGPHGFRARAEMGFSRSLRAQTVFQRNERNGPQAYGEFAGSKVFTSSSAWEKLARSARRVKTSEVVARQLNAVLVESAKGACAYLNGTLLIAYEPVWAIGNGLDCHSRTSRRSAPDD